MHSTSQAFNLPPPSFNSSLLSKSHLSNRLWLPSIRSTSPSTPFNSILSNSWFSSNRFSSLSSISSSVINPSLPFPLPSIRSIKLEFVPSPSLYSKLKQAFNATHTIYLLSLGHPPSLKSYRSFLLNDCSYNIFSPHVKAYFTKVPYDVRDGVLRDFIQAYSTQCQLVKEGKKEKFEMRYRSKRDIFEKSIVLIISTSNNPNKASFFFHVLGVMNSSNLRNQFHLSIMIVE